MSIVKKPGDLIPVPVQSGKQTVTYRWRYPTGYQAIQVSSTLHELGGRDRSPVQIYNQMLLCLDQVFEDPADPDGVSYREEVEAQKARLQALVDAAPGDDQIQAYRAMVEGDAALTPIADLLCQARSVPECVKLARMRADSAVYHAKLGLAVATHLLAEVDPHPEGVVKVRRGLPPPQALVDRIVPEAFEAIGWSYQLATRPGESAEKNSVSPPPGSSPPDSSETANTPT